MPGPTAGIVSGPHDHSTDDRADSRVQVGPRAHRRTWCTWSITEAGTGRVRNRAKQRRVAVRPAQTGVRGHPRQLRWVD